MHNNFTIRTTRLNNIHHFKMIRSLSLTSKRYYIYIFFIYLKTIYLFTSLFRFISQQLSINPLTYLHPRYRLTHFQRGHINIQLTLIHQVSNYKSRRNNFTISTIKQRLPFAHMFLNLFTNDIKVNNHLSIIVKW